MGYTPEYAHQFWDNMLGKKHEIKLSEWAHILILPIKFHRCPKSDVQWTYYPWDIILNPLMTEIANVM